MSRASEGGTLKDFLDEVIESRSKSNADFPEMVEAALQARQLLHALAERRKARDISQTWVAAMMGTSQSALARLESGQSDPRISTVARYARALGEELSLSPAK